MEREFIMVKPDGVQRAHIGDIITRIERAGLKIVAMKILQVTREQAEKHYAVHKDKPFYAGLIEYITNGPAVAMVVEGRDAVKHARRLVGATDPHDALPGSIRGDYGLNIERNIVHAADSVENAKTEYSIYFDEKELIVYTRIDEAQLYA
ncbi:MAG: nucleoside-diphosphate kinase [Candidatus Bathyarchaeota archaeon]|nr:nucleoside-diphosphate kinase [Candidatus Bathyarchaeota archaeon]